MMPSEVINFPEAPEGLELYAVTARYSSDGGYFGDYALAGSHSEAEAIIKAVMAGNGEHDPEAAEIVDCEARSPLECALLARPSEFAQKFAAYCSTALSSAAGGLEELRSLAESLAQEAGAILNSASTRDILVSMEDAPPLALAHPEAHPLPLGTKILSVLGESDMGAMSWDQTETEVERTTGPNAVGIVSHCRFIGGDQGWAYDVIFPESEVWVSLDQADFTRANDEDYCIQELGDGTAPVFPQPNDYRDPAVVRQIEEINGHEPTVSPRP